MSTQRRRWEVCILLYCINFTHIHALIHSQTQETHALVSTILDVQPRLASSGGGKTSDEIVYELAENILNRIPEKLDLEKASPELFEVSISSADFKKEIPVHHDTQHGVRIGYTALVG